MGGVWCVVVVSRGKTYICLILEKHKIVSWWWGSLMFSNTLYFKKNSVNMMGSKAMFDWRCNELKAQTHAKFFLPFSHFNFLGLVAQSSFLGLACVFRFQLCLWDFRPKLPTLCSEWSKNQRAHSTSFGGLAPYYTCWHWLFARWLDSCPSVNLDQRPPWASQGPAWAVFKGRFRPWVDLIIQTHNPQIEKNFNWYPIKQIREMQIIEKGIEFETSEKSNSNRLPILIKV